MYVTIRRGDLLRMRSSMRFRFFCWFAVRSCPARDCPRDLGSIGGYVGPPPQTSMIRRRLGYACGTKAGTGNDGTTTIHTGHDDQSETDSQSQFSEETNTARQVLSSKRKALVRTDKECERSPSELLR